MFDASPTCCWRHLGKPALRKRVPLVSRRPRAPPAAHHYREVTLRCGARIEERELEAGGLN